MAVKHTLEQRKKLTAEFKASGKSQNEWCKERGIGSSTLSAVLQYTCNRPS